MLKTPEQFGGYDEADGIISENQVDAITRAVVLVGKDKKLTFDDITRVLAKAEKDAKFMCGFEMLESAPEVKKQLLESLITRGFVIVDSGGYIQLTSDGLKKAETELPPEIEQYL